MTPEEILAQTRYERYEHGFNCPISWDALTDEQRQNWVNVTTMDLAALRKAGFRIAKQERVGIKSIGLFDECNGYPDRDLWVDVEDGAS